LTLVGAGKIPIFFPLSLINRAAGTQGMSALGTDSHTREDAFTDLDGNTARFAALSLFSGKAADKQIPL